MTTDPTQDPKAEEKHAGEAHRSGLSHHSESLNHPLKRHFPSSEQEWIPERVASYITPDYAERLSADFNDTIRAVRVAERNHAEKLAEALRKIQGRFSEYEMAHQIATSALADWQEEAK